MRNIFLQLSLWTLLTSGATVAAIDIQELIPLLPSCVLPCMVKGVTGNLKVVNNPEAFCTNVTLLGSISECVQSNCIFTDQAKISLLNGKFCEGVPIDESRVWAVAIVGIVTAPLALIAIALRMYSRWAVAKVVGWDDWVILVTGAILCALLGLDIDNCLRYGFGRHYWNLNVFTVETLLKQFYVAEVLYVVVITLVKVSILLFYLRVFPTPWFRAADLTLMVITIASGVAVGIPIIFQCSPVRGAWDRTIDMKCLNLNKIAFAMGGIGVALDILILVLPLPELLRLKMNIRKKLYVIFMFMIGSVACITSIVRLQYLAHFESSTDITWDNALPALWSILEICIAIICACLPAMRSLLTSWFPGFLSIETANYNSDMNSSARRSNHWKPHLHSRSRSRTEKSATTTTVTTVSNGNVETPDQELIDHISSQKVGSTETRIWVNDKSENHGTMLVTDEVSRVHSRDGDSDMSLFAIEGSRQSDESLNKGVGRGRSIRGRAAGNEDIAMRDMSRRPSYGIPNQVLVETSMTQTYSSRQSLDRTPQRALSTKELPDPPSEEQINLRLAPAFK